MDTGPKRVHVKYLKKKKKKKDEMKYKCKSQQKQFSIKISGRNS